MPSSREYTNNELNYFRICHVTTSVLPKALRIVFKKEWDACYPRSPWINCSKNAIDFYNGESKVNQKRLDKEPLIVIRNGNINEWDCTSLFFAILNSTSIGISLSHSVKTWVESLRDFRNKSFAHKPDGSVSDSEFQSSIQDVIDALNGLCLDTNEVLEIKKEKIFTTQELNAVDRQLEKEKETKEKLEKQIKSLEEEMNAETESFCSLPPKPSHETCLRQNDVSAVLQKMEEMEQGYKEDISVTYLSGNPGCGKSQLAAQVAEAYYTMKKEAGATFVMTLDGKDLDTLLESYTNFARLLGCTEHALSTCQSECQTREKMLIFLRSLVISKIRRFFSWLIVVDNVTDIKLLSQYWPQPGAKEWGKGQVIITTQDSNSVPLSHSRSHYVSLKHGMEPSDACKLLCNICSLPIESCTKAEEIVVKLDYQPLAIACAAIYIKYTEISFEQYLTKIIKGEREKTEEVFESLDLSYGKSMTTAVKLAVERAIKQEEILRHAFQFLSLLADENIPVEYVARYVLLQLPKADESVVKCKILNSSLVLNLHKPLKEIKVHQIVHSVFKVTFQPTSNPSLTCVLAFKPLVGCDFKDVNVFVTTRSLVPHFRCLLPTFENLFDGLPDIEYDDIGNCIAAIGEICWRHGDSKLASRYFQKDLVLKRTGYGDNHPAVARSLNNLGVVCGDLVEHQQAKEFHQRALAIRQAVLGDNHPDVATSLNNLGIVCRDLGEHQQAKEFHQRALAIRQAVLGDNHPDVAASLNNLGIVCRDLGEHQQAKEFHQRALAIRQAVLGDNHPNVAASLNNLGVVCRVLGEHQQAKEFQQRALAIRQAVLGDNHPNVAASLNNLGIVCRDLGEHQQAKEFHQRALVIRQAVLGDNHPDVATSLNNLGIVCHYLGEHQQAKELYQRSLAIRQAVLGDNHPDVAASLNNLGVVCCDLVEHQQAKEFHQRALAIRQAVLGDNHPDVAGSLNNLGNVCRDLVEHQQAKEFHQRALAIRQAVLGDNHPDVATSLNNLGTVCCDLGEHQQAKEFHQRALAIRQAVLGDNHPDVAASLNNLGIVCRDLGEHQQAKEFHQRGLAIRQAVLGDNHPDVATSLNNLGTVCCDLGEHQQAKEFHQRALAIRQAVLGDNHPNVAASLNNLGNVCRKLGEHQQVKEFHQRALAIRQAVLGDNHPDVATSLNNLGVVCRVLGEHQQAKEFQQRALAIRQAVLGDNHPDVATSLNNLGIVCRDLGEHQQAKEFHQRALAIRKAVYGRDHPC